MTHLVLLDTEQAAIMTDVADMAVSILGQRLHRADPEGIISASITLQKIKLSHIKAQLDLPALPTFAEMHQKDREAVIAASRVLTSTADQAVQQTAFEKLFAAILQSREFHVRKRQHELAVARSAQDSQTPADARTGADPSPPVRKVSPKKSRRNPSPSAD